MMTARSRAEGFGDEVQRRILIGTYALSAGYVDAYYRKAQQVRTLIRRDFDRAFEQVDLLLSPTSPTTAFRFGAHAEDPLAMYLADLLTIPANMAGLPAINVPCGFDDQGLPIGLQLIGGVLQEATVLQLAHHYEQAARVMAQRPVAALVA
jgi:aspartyl-tRNA(Asn)/glutamyl-tRNA(Gln) amidotransferase subunit A